MIDSLELIPSLKEQFKGKTAVAFVAGSSHLCQEENSNTNFDLNPLFQELVHHKSVILLPKF